MELKGARILVTGGSRGIGAALARAYAAEGAEVVVAARSVVDLQAVADEVGGHAVVVDLSDPAAVEGLVPGVEADLGPIDVLVNNAGRSQRATALDTSMDEVRSLMELNFFVPVALTKAVVPGMVERGRGRVVIVSSVAGYVSTPMRSTYNASKFAVRGWFDALRAELHETGVGVTVVVPGYIRTEINHAAVGSERRDSSKPDPVESGLPPEHCAAVIVDAVAKDRPEVHVGGKELAAIHLNRLMPSLVRRLAHKFAP